MIDKNAVRFRAELDQLECRMMNEIYAGGEEWFDDAETVMRALLAIGGIAADVARLAKIGQASLLREIDKHESEEWADSFGS